MTWCFFLFSFAVCVLCLCVGVWVCGCVGVWVCAFQLWHSSFWIWLVHRLSLQCFHEFLFAQRFLLFHYTSGTGKGGILKRFFCCLFFGLSSSVARSTFYSKTLKKKKSKSPFLSLFLFFLSPSLSRKAILLHRAILLHNNCVYRSHIYASNKSSKK